jgi:glycogen operon protein
MRPEDWQYSEGRLLCVRRAVRLEDERTEISLLLINNTADLHGFELPQPPLPWVAHLDSAHPEAADRDLTQTRLEVEGRSVQLLTAIVAAEPPEIAVHAQDDKAPEPENVS